MNDAINRRDFLERSIAAGALAALPAASWARVRGANERVRIGMIGCGPQGQAIIRNLAGRAEEDAVEVGRVCDLFRRRIDAASALVEGVAGAGLEYREVLDDPAIDAVVVATPDHWHAKIAVEALEAGKAVMIETPLSHTIEQAFAIRDAAERTGGVVAVAARRCSDDRYWKLREAILRGRIGRVSWSQTSFCLNGRIAIFNRPYDRAATPDPDSPAYVWWDRWLGHEYGLAPKVPWDPDRFFRFPKYDEYSNGMAGEFLFAQLAPLMLALAGPEGEEPSRAVCGGGHYNLFDGRNVPDQLFAVLDFPTEHSVTLATSGVTDRGFDEVVRGRHGSAILRDDGVRFEEQAAFYPEFRGGNKDIVDAGMSQDRHGRWIPDPPKGEVGFTIAPEERRDSNGNFLDAIRGESKPDCGIKLACSTMIGIVMLAHALRTRKVVLWDSETRTLSES